MGRSRRPRPAHLAAKLRRIRTSLGLTQQQMFGQLGETRTALYPGHVGLYESGQREPPLIVLLKYARIAGIYVDVLIDDELDLPVELPAKPPPTRVASKRLTRLPRVRKS